MDFVLLGLKLCPIEVVILFLLWIKSLWVCYCSFFLCNFNRFLVTYVRDILVTNHFSLLLIDRYILAIHQIINICHSFSSVVIFWTVSEALAPWSKQQKVAKTTSKLSSLSNSSQKPSFFAVLMYALYGHLRISNSRENINNTSRVSRLYFCFLWLCPSFHYVNQNYHHY